MRHIGRLAALFVVGMFFILHPSKSNAQSFYTGSGTNMFRVFGCPPNATLNINGTGPSQQGDCTLYAGNVVAAIPIETWVLAQLGGGPSILQAQNEKLQRQVDELTARVQALETAVNRSRGTTAPGSKPGAATK